MLAIEAADMGTFDWNLETKHFFCSNRLKEIFGFRPNDHISHENLINTFHPEDRHIRQKAMKEALAKGSLEYEIRIIWPDESVHWIKVCGKIFKNANLLTKRMYGTVIDTTEQRVLLENLKESEASFRLFADSMPQFIWTSDALGNLYYYNQYVYEYSGLSFDQISKDGWIQMVHPDDRDENIRRWMHSISTGENFVFEHRFRRYDGQYRWQLSRAIPKKNAAGTIQMWVGTSTDIQTQKAFSSELEKKNLERTLELKNIIDELRKSEERYHLMVAEVQDYAIFFLNKDGIIENWNKGAEKIKGYKSEEIIGRSFSVFYTEKDRQSFLPQRLLNEAIENGRASHEGWRVRKDGSLFWGYVVLTALHDEQKNVIGFSKVTRDLTEKKRADDKMRLDSKELEEKNKELKKMNAELESFAYVASHDLQEPLRKIQTFASLIIEKEKQNLSENGKDYFSRMQIAAKRMQLLIDDLLSYSRAGNNSGIFFHIDLNEIIEEVKNELKELIEQKKVVIESNMTCNARLIPFQFRQLMLNLIGNSIKFSRPDLPAYIKLQSEMIHGGAAEIEMLDPKKTYCHISISDNGIGFDPKYADRIFEVFQRLHGKDRYEGTGIGLAIVKKIVDNHLGVITCKGDPGKGAKFDIYFPQ